MDTITKPNTQLLTAKALAKMFSISVRTVWRLRSAGKLPKPVAIGGSIRWRLSDIELWQSMDCPHQKEFLARREVSRSTKGHRR